MNLPSAFKERMKEMLGAEYQAFEDSYDRERTQGLRLNLLKTAPERFLAETPFQLKQIPWVKEGFYYSSEDRPGRHPWHEAGVYYIQEPSAMAVVTFLDPQPGEKVLDLCAAPGGKTTQIASRLGGEGFLLSNEIHPARAKILSQNVERMGIPNAVVTNEDSGHLAEYFPEFFDKIVVDAPCSGEGMFRKEEIAVQEWSPENVQHCAERQQEILSNAAGMLKPGGRLVYSTCTFAPEENEKSICRFLAAHREFSIEETPKFEGLSCGVPDWGEIDSGYGYLTEKAETNENAAEKSGRGGDVCGLEETIRIWPHRTGGEGHYIAVLRKHGEAEPRKRKEPKYYNDKKALSDYAAFCQETLTGPERWTKRKEYVLFGEQLYLLPPEMISFDRLRVLRPGLHLGTLKKNRFEPSHALALALRAGDVNVTRNFAADSGFAAAYLKGEALEDAMLLAEDSQGAEHSERTKRSEGAVDKTTAGKNGKKEKKPAKGWALMTVDGYSLGWAKLAGGILKNHYPKGLRK